MKKTTLYLFLLLSFSLYSQVRVSGTVYDQNNRPLVGASVYLNNTSIGATTDDEGFFEFRTNKGVYTLVVSFIGYETKSQKLNTRKYKNPLRIKLKEKSDVLNEVVIKKIKRMSRSKRNAYLRKFQRAFLGRSEFGKKCKVLNKEVLDYEVSQYDDTFEVYAKEPIKILNPKLGYIIYYDLVHFELTPASITYFGYTRYEEIEGLDQYNEKWEKSRFKAYRGSLMHFLRSVRNEEVKEQGFVVDNLKRIPNPERPSNKEIKDAVELLKKTQGLQDDPYKNRSVLNEKIAQAQKIIELAKLPEFIDEILGSNIGMLQYAIVHDMEIYLQFLHTLRVTYLDEEPDRAYDSSQSSSEYQVSMLNMYKKNAMILESGVFDKPYDVFLRGYWAFEKVGDQLPLDYMPPHKHRPLFDTD